MRPTPACSPPTSAAARSACGRSPRAGASASTEGSSSWRRPPTPATSSTISPPPPGLPVLRVGESEEDGDGIVRVVDATPRVPDFGAATFGRQPGQTASVQLPPDVTVEVLAQQDTELTIRMTRRR